MRPISSKTVLRKPQKKIPKHSKQIFLFKVIAINCKTQVGAIFLQMHCSQKISKRNGLPFHRCRCLNVAYGCISVPRQLHFQLQKRQVVGQTQIKRVWGGGWLSILHEQPAVPIVLLSTHVTQSMHTVVINVNTFLK